MTITDILLLLLIAAVVGWVARALVGYKGGLIVTIAVGFIGAVLGGWIAGRLGLPEIFSVNVGGITIPIIWAIIGAALFVALIALLSRGSAFVNVTPPTQVVLVLSVVLAILSILSSAGQISLPLSAYALMGLAYLILLIGNLVKGL
jgi:uncharacterized membrane protein YeaQ/YmgE (transglycosylase-associated protein family)